MCTVVISIPGDSGAIPLGNFAKSTYMFIAFGAFWRLQIIFEQTIEACPERFHWYFQWFRNYRRLEHKPIAIFFWLKSYFFNVYIARAERARKKYLYAYQISSFGPSIQGIKDQKLKFENNQ